MPIRRVMNAIGAVSLLVAVSTSAHADDVTAAASSGVGAIRGSVVIDPPDALVPLDLARCVVYVASIDGTAPEPAPGDAPIAQRPQIAQRGKAFIPSFLVVPAGTVVEFPNWDDFSHNVFSRSPAAPPFDLDRYGYGVSKSYRFTTPGMVQVFCNIHPKMRATIFVTPGRYFAVADADGRFELTGVPAGAIDLAAWHPRCQEARIDVALAPDVPARVDLVLDQSVNRLLAERRRRDERGVRRGLGVRRRQLDLPVVDASHPACCDPEPAETGPR